MNSHVANTESLAFVRNVRMTFSQHHFGSAPRRPVSYIWLDLVGEDGIVSQAKIYYQQKTVQYADYRPEMLYVSPHQVTKVRKLSQEVAA
jgi:hypothetical protein